LEATSSGLMLHFAAGWNFVKVEWKIASPSITKQFLTFWRLQVVFLILKKRKNRHWQWESLHKNKKNRLPRI